MSKRGFPRRKRTPSPGYMQESGEERARSLCARFHVARLCATCKQTLPLQDRATQSYKIPPKFPALTIASSRRGCHYHFIILKFLASFGSLSIFFFTFSATFISFRKKIQLNSTECVDPRTGQYQLPIVGALVLYACP